MKQSIVKLSLTVTLSFLSAVYLNGCSDKKSGDANSTLGQQGATAQNSTSVSCPSTGVVDTKGAESSTPVANLYRQYIGATPNTLYSNTGLGFKDYIAGNLGNWVGIAKGMAVLGKPVDLKGGQVLALKLVEHGGLQLIAGTVSNLQVCPVNDASGIETDKCKVYDRVGGVSSVDVLGDNIYFATVSGDFGFIGFNALDTQTGCGRLLYSSAENVNTQTNTPSRAFRVAAGSDSVYFLARNNSGDSAFNLNSLAANLKDWLDSTKILAVSRETSLYRYVPGENSPTKVDLGDANYHYLMDDLVSGSDGKVYASYWAPRVEDVKAAQACVAVQPLPPICPGFTAATPLHIAFAYFFNSKQGLLAVQGTEVKAFAADPAISINAENGCSADALAASPPTCLRFPSVGLFFFNRIAALKDSIIMRGIFGYARLTGDSFEVKTGIPLNADSPSLGFPFKAGATDTYAGANGFFFDFNPLCLGCLIEKATFSGANPMTVVAGAMAKVQSDAMGNNVLLAGGHHSAYVFRQDTFKRIGLKDPSDDFEYPIPNVAGDPYETAGLFPVAVQLTNPPAEHDHVVAFRQHSHDFFILSFADENAATFNTAKEVLEPAFTQVDYSPVAYLDNFVFVLLNGKTVDPGGHRVKVYEVDWSANTATEKKFMVGDGASQGILGVDKISSGYQVYVWAGMNISVLTFPFDGTTWGAPTKKNIPNPSTARGVTAGGENIYFILEDGTLNVTKADGSGDRTVPNAVDTAGGKISFSLGMSYVNGKVVIPALLQTPNAPTRAVTGYVDLNNETKNHTYPIPYLFGKSFGDKFFGGSFLNGIEAFDFSKEPVDTFKGGSVDLGGSKSAAPAGGGAPTTPTTPGSGNNVAGGGAEFAGGGGCSLRAR